MKQLEEKGDIVCCRAQPTFTISLEQVLPNYAMLTEHLTIEVEDFCCVPKGRIRVARLELLL